MSISLYQSLVQKQSLVPVVTMIWTTKMTQDVVTLDNHRMISQSLETEALQIIDMDTHKPLVPGLHIDY